MRSTNLIKEIREVMKEKSQTKGSTGWTPIPSGVSMFDIACTDNGRGAFKPGTVVNIVGDSHTGKTILALTVLATVANIENYNDYELIYDDVEAANSFDMEYLFGEVGSERIRPPYYLDEEAVYSNTVQNLITNVNRLLKVGKPFIYILDSLDALTSDEEIARQDKFLKAVDAGKEADLGASYKAEKAKYMSEFFRKTKREFEESGNLLVIISQTRDKIGAGPFEPKKYRTGGAALDFYCSIIIWLAFLGGIKNEKWKRVVGSSVRAKITKNKYTGKKRSFEFNIYNDLGIDDIGSMIDFLVLDKYWKKTGRTIKALGLDVEMTRAKLIEHIEENNLERKVKRFCQKLWREIEGDLKLDRKKRFEQ